MRGGGPSGDVDAAPRVGPLLGLYAVSALAWGLAGPLTRKLGAGAAPAFAALALKAVLWLAPAVLYARRAFGEPWREALALGAPRREGLARAFVVGALYLGVVVALSALLNGASQPAAPTAPQALLALTNATVEEAAFRGFLLLHLARGRRFFRANLLCAGLFVLVHLPAFFAQGAGPEVAIMSLALFAFALALGEVTRAAGAIWPAVVVHTINNLIAG